MRKWVLFFSCFILCCSFTSCRTTETTVEYIPVTIDVEDLIKPILDLRPDDVKLIDDPQSLSDVMQNSVSFQFAYQNWRAYALTLEDFYLDINKAQATQPPN